VCCSGNSESTWDMVRWLAAAIAVAAAGGGMNWRLGAVGGDS
jgi:hypothetical protein